MIKIAIIEDEKEIREYLVSLIQKQAIDAEVFPFASAEEFLQENQRFDLLFLDIELERVASFENTIISKFKSTSVDLGERRVVQSMTNSLVSLYHPPEVLSWREIVTPTKTDLINSPPIEVRVSNDKMNGMELAKYIRTHSEHQPMIVFVTGYEDYVFDAFDIRKEWNTSFR